MTVSNNLLSNFALGFLRYFNVNRCEQLKNCCDSDINILSLFVGMLQHLFRQGPYIHGWDYTSLSSDESTDKKELKLLLIEGGLFCISDYSNRVILFIIKSFLKHMPEPLLNKEFYNLWIEIGNILHIESNFPVEAKTQLMLHDLALLMESASYYTDLLLRHLLVSLHSLSCRNRRSPDMRTVDQLARLFAPYVIYKRFEWVKGRNSYKKLMMAKQALTKFLIMHVYQIFGRGAQNLYPSIDITCQNSYCPCNLDKSACSVDSGINNLKKLKSKKKNCK